MMICPQCKHCWEDGSGEHCPECVRPKEAEPEDQEKETKEDSAYTLLTREELERSSASLKGDEAPMSAELTALSIQLNARLDNLESLIKDFHSNKDDNGVESPNPPGKCSAAAFPYSIPAGLLTGGNDAASKDSNNISDPTSDSDDENEPVGIWEGGVRRPTTLRRFDLRRFLPADQRDRPLHFENTMHLVSPYMSLVMELTSMEINTHGVLSHLTFILELAARNLYTTEEMVEYDRRMRERANRDGLGVFVEGEPYLANRCFRDSDTGSADGAQGGANAASAGANSASAGANRPHRRYRRGGPRGGYRGNRGSYHSGYQGGYRGHRGAYLGGKQSGYQGASHGGHHGAYRGAYHYGYQGPYQRSSHHGYQGASHGRYQGGYQGSGHGGYQGGAHSGYQGSAHGGYQGGAHGGYQGGPHGGYQGGAHGGYQGASYNGYQGTAHGGYQGASYNSYQGASYNGYQGASYNGYQGASHRRYQGGYNDGYHGNHFGGYRGGYHGGHYSSYHGGYNNTGSGRQEFTGWRRLAAEKRICFAYCQGRLCHGCRYRHVCTYCSSNNHTMFNCPIPQHGGRR